MSDELDYAELDPGIVDVVRHLRARGYDTTDSGDGETKFKPGSGYNVSDLIEVPHVVVALRRTDVLKASAHRLCEVLRARFGEGWAVQASYDTNDGASVLYAYKGGA